MKKLFLAAAISLMPFFLLAQAGDTTYVQTYTFDAQNNPNTDYDSPGRRTFDFPEDDGTTYQKILMYYTLKCFEDGTAGGLGFDCGEWDYTTHTFLYEHTGELDSAFLEHPRYLVNNESFDELSVSNIPLINTYQIQYEQVGIDAVGSENIHTSENVAAEFYQFQQNNAGHVQFYLTQEYLDQIGLAADNIQKLAFYFSEQLSLSEVTLKMTELSTAPDGIYDGAFEDMFFSYDYLTASADNPSEMIFNTPFSWSGDTGILIDLTFSDCSDSFNIQAENSGTTQLVTSAGNKYIRFNGGDEVVVPPAVFGNVQDEVTVCYWMWGSEEFQPENGTTFEGRNTANQRVINSHAPWGNGRIYWDAGDNNGNYDRIDQQASADDYSGQWNHWAYTKNAVTGEMKLYLNGSLWHSGDNKFNDMDGITKFIIGNGASVNHFYRGSIDDFYVFNAELTEEEIQEYMNNSHSEDLPASENELLYYSFDNDYGELLTDGVSGSDALAVGNPALVAYEISEVNTNWTEIDKMPLVTFYQGEYGYVYTDVIYEVEEQVPPLSAVEYVVSGNQIDVLNVDAYYPLGYSYTYNPQGEIIDSLANTPAEEITLINETYNYYGEPFEVVNRIELGRFITPYGIGLDLEEGWTWVYEVTDYEPLLHGEVELEAGNWQELLDLKFAFIEGTPPRDVKRVENIWAGNWQLSSWNETVQEQTVEVQDGEEMFKVRATTSGHWFGQGNNCAEFCQNMHSLDVNGTTEHAWEMMQECADNPLYPQGGTWIYDRAGWCPGAPVTTRELEITDAVNGQDFAVDYNIEYDPYGNYWLMGQLVTYGGHNFQTDVEISEILAPSDFKLNSRINPICKNPEIRIRNNGSETLTSCTITYGVNGVLETYEWAGELEFMQTEDISLTYSNPELWEGAEEELMTFNVEISMPNGQADPNPSNNVTSSKFYRPAIYHYDDYDDNRIIVEMNTNNTPWETQATLYTIDGGIMWSSNYTEANTLYRDTLTLNSGCYKFHVTDSDDDGISFFANNDGNGFLRMRKVQGFYFDVFEDNFGKELIHHFNFETDLVSGIEELPVKDVKVYPNPSTGVVYLEGLNLRGNAHYTVINSSGKTVLSDSHYLQSSSDRIEVDLSGFANGIYSLKLEMNGEIFQKRMVKL